MSEDQFGVDFGTSGLPFEECTVGYRCLGLIIETVLVQPSQHLQMFRFA